MDPFESKFAASLQAVAADVADRSPAGRTTPARRGGKLAELVAAAAVGSVILGGSMAVAQWTNRSDSPDRPELAPAEPGETSPTASTPPAAGSRAAVAAVTEQLAGFSGSPGFGKVVANYELAQVTVYWVGTPPEVVQSVVGTTPTGVTVVLKHARYSEQDLTTAGKRVMDQGRQVLGPGVIVATLPTHDMSGLVVEVTQQVDIEALEEAAGGVPLELRLVEDEGEVLGSE